MPEREDINALVKPLVHALEANAGQCRTAEDLAEAAKLGRWLMAIANRNLGMAVIAYAHDGMIPGPPRGSFAARAAMHLETEGLEDPDLERDLTHVLQLQRATQHAYNAVIDHLPSPTTAQTAGDGS